MVGISAQLAGRPEWSGQLEVKHVPNTSLITSPSFSSMSAPGVRRGSTTGSYLDAPNVDTPKGASDKKNSVSD